MYVQCPGKARGFALHENIAQTIQEIIPVPIPQKDPRPSNPSSDDMMKGTSSVNP